MIYVSDFDLDASQIKSGPGLLSALAKAPGPLSDMLPSLPGAPKDPNALAPKLVDTMAKSTVKNLTKAGLNARRLSPGAPLPTSGWLIRGIFAEVNQGNQLRRTLIGFGSGKTELQLVVDISDLTQGRRFYQLNTTADSGKAPGSGPIIALGLTRLVITGKDLERNVKQTAAQIAAEIVRRTQPPLSLAAASTDSKSLPVEVTSTR